jgi:hypothetical protein
LINARKENLYTEWWKKLVNKEIDAITALPYEIRWSIEEILVSSLTKIWEIGTENAETITKIKENLNNKWKITIDENRFNQIVEVCSGCITWQFDINAIKAVWQIQFVAKEQYLYDLKESYKDWNWYGIDRSAWQATFATIRKILEAYNEITNKNDNDNKDNKDNKVDDKDNKVDDKDNKVDDKDNKVDDKDNNTEIDAVKNQINSYTFEDANYKFWNNIAKDLNNYKIKLLKTDWTKITDIIFDKDWNLITTEFTYSNENYWIENNGWTITIKKIEDKNNTKNKTEEEKTIEEIKTSLTTFKINENDVTEIIDTAKILIDYYTNPDNEKLKKLIEKAINETTNDGEWTSRKTAIIEKMTNIYDTITNNLIDKSTSWTWVWANPDIKIDNNALKEKQKYKNALDKIARQKIEKIKLPELFEEDKNYFDHLAINLWSVEEYKGWYKAKFIILSNDKTSKYQEPEKEINIEFDNKWKITTNTIIMPNMFGVARKYEMDKNWKFIEKTKALREKLLNKQNDMIKDMINWSDILNVPTTKIWEIDIDGNYKITFDIPSIEIKRPWQTFWKKVEWVKNQEFKIHFTKIDNLTESEINSLKRPKILPWYEKVYIKTKDANIEKKWLLGKDYYWIFTVRIGNKNNKKYFDIDVTTTKEKQKLEEKNINISWLEDITPFYKQTKDEKTKESIFNIIDAKPSDKFYDLTTLETKNNWKNLKEPEKQEIYPFGTENNDSFIKKNIFVTFKDMINWITNSDWFYKLSENEIYEVIWKYNNPINKKVYIIENPKTKETKYYTAEKINWEKEDQIKFTKDLEIEKYIKEKQNELQKRFEEINKIYQKEKKAQTKILNKEFEKNWQNNWRYNIWLYDTETEIQRNQKGNILDKWYDTSKIKYKGKIWYSETEKSNPTKNDWTYDATRYVEKWMLYFNNEWSYDKETNWKYYTEDKWKNRPIINNVIWTFQPDNSWVIKFRDEVKKNKSKWSNEELDNEEWKNEKLNNEIDSLKNSYNEIDNNYKSENSNNATERNNFETTNKDKINLWNNVWLSNEEFLQYRFTATKIFNSQTKNRQNYINNFNKLKNSLWLDIEDIQ